ncbi:hypothetical protein HMPREF1869_00504 [Bacteroidales bacterium KA00251]|nr:hypothetical protein HMPREF1869_00504 [Bacteroidales bacterium KA00251]
MVSFLILYTETFKLSHKGSCFLAENEYTRNTSHSKKIESSQFALQRFNLHLLRRKRAQAKVPFFC